MHHAVWAPLASFVIALVVTGCLAYTRAGRIALDAPNSRSLHVSPIPRLGGIGVLAGIALGAALSHAIPVSLYAPAVVLLALVSLADDLKGIPVAVRLVAHVLAASWLAYAVYPDVGPTLAAIIALACAWMINLYNFMDGSDGLAGGMAFFGFTFYGIAASLAGDTSFGTLCFSIAAAAGAFLCFNFPPAKIFMGDVGAVPLGFLAATLGTVGWLAGYWAWWFAPLVFSPFIVDATITLARRALRRERVWQAHFEHYYQRLVRMGWGHRNTALVEYALMIGCGALGLAMLRTSAAAQVAALAAIAVAYIALALGVDRAWLRFSSR